MDDGGPAPISSLGMIHEVMADEAIEVMSSYCADKQIVALNGLANTSSEDRVRKSATKRAEQITLSQSFFEKH